MHPRSDKECCIGFVLMVGLCLTFPASAVAMIKTLPISELVASADLIAIAEVVSIRDDPSRPDGFRVRNELRIKQVLKGAYDASELLVVGTNFRPGQRAIEDSIVFPLEGRRVLLFLRTVTSDTKQFVPVNGIQGLWPLEADTDKTLGMGFRYSIDEVVKLIAA